MLKMKWCLFGIIFTVVAAATANSVGPRMWEGDLAADVVPHHVHLAFFDTASSTPELEYVGSGVLISSRFVLTVAFNIVNFNSWNAGVGNTNYSLLNWFSATGAIPHEGYDPTNLNNNLGVLVFDNLITLVDELVVPAVLPDFTQSLPLANTLGRISGFGFTDPNLNDGKPSPYLLVANQTVTPHILCEAFFPLLGATLDNSFCAIDGDNYSTPCGGEQGAGFEQGGIVVGMFSVTNVPCDQEDSYSYYLRIFNYRQWIFTHTGI